jgi:type III restriction enzyme
MPEQFLYQQLDTASKLGLLNIDIPDSITQNLNPTYELRDYQIDAFSRFIHCYNNNFPGKENPLHLLFNMATGSGKTLIIAGLILYLYEQGYRNFLFFVNSTDFL